MLKFLVYEDGKPAQRWPLRNAYLLGNDGTPLRAEVFFEDGMILCEKRELGTAALALQHRIDEFGEMTLQTCLLPEREEPYLLTLELARHRAMTLYTSLENWGMFDLEPDHPVSQRTDATRRHFVEALCLQNENPAEADRHANRCLASAIDGTEELALAHSELALNSRKNEAQLPDHPVGCGVSLEQINDRLRMGLVANFDFVRLPLTWKSLAPEEGDYRWELADSWMQWAKRNNTAVVTGPLISFDPDHLPDWLYIWEHDYDTVRDLIYEHVERVVQRYRHQVHVWNVVSGLHVNKHFSFNFEQLMDLTRMTSLLVKKTAPDAKTLIEIRQPFGEYYASNPRSIPPLMYADLITQAGMSFDAFSLHLPIGQAAPGQHVRDLMQLSTLMDQFAEFDKPLYLTVAAPSQPVTQAMIANPESNEPVDDNAGFWRQPWSESVQSHWLEALFQIAVSKPFVQGIAWQDLIDHPKIELPLSGLVRENLEPKEAYNRLVTFQRSLKSSSPTPQATDDTSIASTPPTAET